MLKLKPDDPSRIGPYDIVDCIGEGGMGRVYLGHKNGTFAAVKVMTERFAQSVALRSRFRREIEAIGRVQHSFTARLLDSGSDDGRLWYASEYIPGPTLDEAVRIARFDGAALGQFGYSLCAALKAIHAAGIIHRDIKPSNIILGANGVRVVDFGIAALDDASPLTMTGEMLGTVSYMSPEQARGETLTAASDVFAFGSVLVFAATGRPPFTGSNANAIMHAIANPSVQPNVSGVPQDMRGLVQGCLADNARQRSSLLTIEQTLSKRRTATTASTAWMPQPVTTKVQEATRVAVERQKLLVKTRVESKPVAVPAAKKAAPPAPAVLGFPWSVVAWIGAVAAVFGLLWFMGPFEDGTTTASPTPAPTHDVIPNVEVPPPTFKPSKLKTASGNMVATKVTVDDREVHVKVRFSGSDKARETAFAKSCARVTYTETSYVEFKPDVPRDDTPANVLEFRTLLDFPGNMYFFGTCPKHASMQGGQWLGKNKVPNDGFFGGSESLVPVIDAYTKDGKLKVVLPNYSSYDHDRYMAICLKTPKGAAAKPVNLIRAVNNGRDYIVLTYEHKQGTIYTSCSGSDKVSFAGKGAAIP
jgi:predicted Ser/Thr protein kinase